MRARAPQAPAAATAAAAAAVLAPAAVAAAPAAAVAAGAPPAAAAAGAAAAAAAKECSVAAAARRARLRRSTAWTAVRAQPPPAQAVARETQSQAGALRSGSGPRRSARHSQRPSVLHLHGQAARPPRSAAPGCGARLGRAQSCSGRPSRTTRSAHTSAAAQCAPSQDAAPYGRTLRQRATRTRAAAWTHREEACAELRLVEGVRQARRLIRVYCARLCWLWHGSAAELQRRQRRAQRQRRLGRRGRLVRHNRLGQSCQRRRNCRGGRTQGADVPARRRPRQAARRSAR